jgi:hypothetical protein
MHNPRMCVSKAFFHSAPMEFFQSIVKDRVIVEACSKRILNKLDSYSAICECAPRGLSRSVFDRTIGLHNSRPQISSKCFKLLESVDAARVDCAQFAIHRHTPSRVTTDCVRIQPRAFD